MTTQLTPETTGSLMVDGARIANRLHPGEGPLLVWLGGFRSDMAGTKAMRLAALAYALGAACLRFDYSGHGESGGRFEDGTISRWLAEAQAVIAHHRAGRKLILVGSSMGAWIALLAASAHARAGDPVAGLLLLAPAPDFTSELIEPALTQAQRDALANDGFFSTPSAYSPEPEIITRALLEDGRRNRVLTGLIETRCPVAILQGMADPDVPHAHALRLVSHLPLENVTLTLIKDGDHRLSREQDLQAMERAVSAMVSRCGASRADI